MAIDTAAAPEKESASPAKKPARQQASTLFRVVWRWHFFAGLIISPLILVVAITGAIYIFAAEISDMANRNLMYVEEVGTERPFDAMVISAAAIVPDGRVTKVSTFSDPTRTAMLSVAPPESDKQDSEKRGKRGRRRDEVIVAVNPYSGEVQGHSKDGKKLDSFFRVVLKIHRSLFVGTTGRVIVEIATSWMIILFLTGAYLWWPRRKEKVKGVWVPRWKGKQYTLLRDLHAISGVYILPICLTIMVTGLFYSLVWGKGFHVVTTPLFAKEVAEVEEDSAAENKEEGDKQGEEGETAVAYVPPAFSLQAAVEKSRSLYPGRDLTVTLPSAVDDNYQVSAINDWARGTYGAMNSTGFELDRTTGEVSAVSDLWNNERYWWHTWVYPIHVGSVVGPYSKTLWLFACLVLIAMPFTGLWMWWKRKPAGKSGFPKKYSYSGVPVWVWGCIGLFCLLLPMFGLSVIFVILLDLFSRPVRKRFATPA